MMPTIDHAESVLMKTYKRFPIVLKRGRDCRVWDDAGREYVDFIAGIAVCNLGHAHPDIARAVFEQAQQLVHVSNLYYTIPQVEVAEILTAKSFADRVFFCNSGAEANEAAIKLARKYFKENGQPGRFRIVSMERSFHGRTMAALSATGQEKVRKGFDPVLEGFEFVPFNDLEALKSRLDDTTCAVILEPIQGEGGIRCPAPDFLRNVRRLCDETGTLLILDEIQTGMGRTGKLFAHEHYGMAPDIMTLAKALANGLPMGAMLATDRIAEAFGAGSHASTFGGTPLVCAAAREVLRLMTEGHILENCCTTGAYFLEKLHELKAAHEQIEAVRGIGLLLGLKLSVAAEPIVHACLEEGFLVNFIQEKVLRFAPPLTMARADVDALIAALDEIFQRNTP
jgi:acetylornithine aminotransferase